VRRHGGAGRPFHGHGRGVFPLFDRQYPQGKSDVQPVSEPSLAGKLKKPVRAGQRAVKPHLLFRMQAREDKLMRGTRLQPRSMFRLRPDRACEYCGVIHIPGLERVINRPVQIKANPAALMAERPFEMPPRTGGSRQDRMMETVAKPLQHHGRPAREGARHHQVNVRPVTQGNITVQPRPGKRPAHAERGNTALLQRGTSGGAGVEQLHPPAKSLQV